MFWWSCSAVKVTGGGAASFWIVCAAACPNALGTVLRANPHPIANAIHVPAPCANCRCAIAVSPLPLFSCRLEQKTSYAASWLYATAMRSTRLVAAILLLCTSVASTLSAQAPQPAHASAGQSTGAWVVSGPASQHPPKREPRRPAALL